MRHIEVPQQLLERMTEDEFSRSVAQPPLA
jgi:hypothetical protein